MFNVHIMIPNKRETENPNWLDKTPITKGPAKKEKKERRNEKNRKKKWNKKKYKWDKKVK